MNGGTTSALARRTRAARYLLALVLVVGGAVAVLLGGASVCRDHVPKDALTPVSLCGPPAATDAAVVAVVGVVLLLLAPDVGEAGVAGITLKRRVEEAKADAATARADVASLRLTVHSLSQNVDVTTVVESGSAAVLESLAQMGLLKGATPIGTPRHRTGREVPRWGQTLLLTASFEGMLDLLPAQWKGASIVGRVRNLAFTAGPALEGPAQRRLFDEIDVQSRAGRGEVGIMPPTATLPMVVVAPVTDARGVHLGEVVTALPPGVTADESEATEHLKPIRAAFAALAAYALDNDLANSHARPVDSPSE